jgi:hypothetical protein
VTRPTPKYGLPVIDRGDPYVDADGAPILSPSMPLLPSTQESAETRLTWRERIWLAEERLHSDNDVCHEPYGDKQRQPDGDH